MLLMTTATIFFESCSDTQAQDQDEPTVYNIGDLCYYTPWEYKRDGSRKWRGWIDEFGNDHHPATRYVQFIQEQDVYLKAPPHVKKVLTDVEKLKYCYDLSRQFNFNASVMYAQMIQETGWCRKIKGNAHFGIKGSGQEFVTTEYVDYTTLSRYKESKKLISWEVVSKNRYKVLVKENFRKYDSWRDSFRHYAYTRQNNKIRDWKTPGKSPGEEIKYLHEQDYATGPSYSERVNSNMNLYFLKKLDEVIKY